MRIKDNKKGFTLIEIMVSISIFAVIMLMVSSSIFTIFESNRKSQSLRAVMDNLNLSLESMTRTIRFGKNYHCDILSGNVAVPADCPLGFTEGASSIAILDSSNVVVEYSLSGGRIVRVRNGGTPANVTGSDVTIDKLTFRVVGSAPYANGTNLYQPKVVMVVGGYAGSKPSSRSSFILHTTVSQRQFDSL